MLRSVAASDVAARSKSIKIRPQAGFTLLELLAVIALMAVVAGTALLAYEGVQDQGRQDATRFEMAEIRSALLKFRRDSGSNDLPGQGVYVCEDPANAGKINPDLVNLPAEAGTTDDAKLAWCESPANFWMLFADPLGSGWNPDTHRGWNGPYLQRKSGLMSYAGVDDLWVITDAYQATYLLLDLDDPVKARLVSIGPDKTDNNPTPSSCQIAGSGDDTLLCLLR
ncbi:type II secretion system protein [Methylomonas methanica]|uniref:Prepilin-type N-terminal cleavage/methylation domain-containing protein n=1 Tax=Methylomonas methanica TaxID=421 RepID=A0A177MI78_METMH|nr:type II secretion system protein [Methylomonas methanica]OAI05507.1 hypothetical protein A1332_13200 [Methylomonas methanica]